MNPGWQVDPVSFEWIFLKVFEWKLHRFRWAVGETPRDTRNKSPDGFYLTAEQALLKRFSDSYGRR